MPQRVYRHDFRCPHRRSNSLPKAGPSAASRPTHARDCPHRFTPDGNRHCYPEHVNRRALKTYEDGSSVAAISRVMGVKEATIYSWDRKSAC